MIWEPLWPGTPCTGADGVAVLDQSVCYPSRLGREAEPSTA
ncbi:hypothetical protein [Streptomyces sp. NPDC004232]